MSQDRRIVAVIAAEAFELRGLQERLKNVVTLDWPIEFACEGTRGNVSYRLLANGPGPRLAARAADIARERGRVDAIVSAGLCGGLEPSLQVGDIFVASRIVALETGETFVSRVNELARERRYPEGLLCSMDRVAVTAADKAALRAHGASAVEMEAAGVARRSLDWCIPLECLRVVSDTANESFSMDLNQMRDGEGRFRRARIAAAALARPWARVPELLRLRRRGHLCSEILGELLADCRF